MEKKRVLVLCDDLWHPAEIIERGLALLPQERYRFDVVRTAKDILTPAYIAAYPLILCCKSNCVNQGNSAPWFEAGVTEVMPEDFERYVRAGGGFLAVHSGLAYRDVPGMNTLLGSVFEGHPPRCRVSWRVSNPDHPVARGVTGFACRDEHDRIGLTDPQAERFLESESDAGGVQPAGYTRLLNRGRLCALTPGHTMAVWEQPMFLRLLQNAMAWCMKEAIP